MSRSLLDDYGSWSMVEIIDLGTRQRDIRTSGLQTMICMMLGQMGGPRHCLWVAPGEGPS